MFTFNCHAFTAIVGITLGVFVSSHGKYLGSSVVLFQHRCSLILTVEVNNGVKKEVSSKDVARIWANEEIKMRSFSPVNVRGPPPPSFAVYALHVTWTCSWINFYGLCFEVTWNEGGGGARGGRGGGVGTRRNIC